MIFRYEKQLNDKNALLLRKAINKCKVFANLNDYKILFKDYANFYKNKNFKHYADMFPPTLSLGKFIYPNNNLVKEEDVINFTNDITSIILKKELELEFYDKYMDEGLCFIVNEVEDGAILSSEIIFDNYFDDEEDEDDENDAAPTNNFCGFILMLGLFFHNKIDVYEKICKALISEKKEYIKKFGNEFTNDLILLFSASKNDKTKQKNKIIIEGIEKSRIPRHKGQKNWLKIGDINPFWFHLESEKGAISNCYGFYLDENNKIILDVCYSSYKKRLSNSEDNEFDNLIQETINEWVNQYISAINFTSCIYNKIKSKFLFEIL